MLERSGNVGIAQPQPGFVTQSRHLQLVTARFVLHFRARDPPQLLVNHASQIRRVRQFLKGQTPVLHFFVAASKTMQTGPSGT
jgi:hypothetical protein